MNRSFMLKFIDTLDTHYNEMSTLMVEEKVTKTVYVFSWNNTNIISPIRSPDNTNTPSRVFNTSDNKRRPIRYSLMTLDRKLFLIKNYNRVILIRSLGTGACAINTKQSGRYSRRIGRKYSRFEQLQQCDC